MIGMRPALRTGLGPSVATVFLFSIGFVAAGCAVDPGTGEDDAAAAQAESLTVAMIFSNAATASCMDAPATWAGAIPPVTQRACNGGTTQRISRSGDASWFALRDAAGRCFQVTGGTLGRAACSGPTLSVSQRFTLGPLSPSPRGMARTLKTATGLCVDGAPGPFVGMPLRVAPCTGGPSQQWLVLEGVSTP